MSTHDSSSHLRSRPDAFPEDAGAPGGAPSAASISGLLAAAQRLTAELAATQIAVQELTAEIARAGLRAEAPASTSTATPGATPSAPAGPALVASAPPARDADDDAPSLPPRRGDHAVISPAPTEQPVRPAPAVAAAAAPSYAAPVSAPPAAAPLGEAPYGGQPAAAPFGEAPAAPQAAGPGVLGGAMPLPTERPMRQQPALQHQGPVLQPEHPAPVVERRPAPAVERQPAPALERQPGMAEVFDRTPAPAPSVITELSPSAGARPVHEAPSRMPGSPFDGPDHASSLADVPLLSAGSVEVLVGPVTSLADLDALQGRILELPGVEAATVTAFEGHDVLMSVDLDRPLPLASMLRTELGRDVSSCRLVEGRIVVTFVHRGSAA